MAATIIDVARLCGYSKATVSRAYASPEAVSEKAREKIYAAAKQLNYAPNAIARAMVRQQTENIAFIILFILRCWKQPCRREPEGITACS